MDLLLHRLDPSGLAAAGVSRPGRQSGGAAFENLPSRGRVSEPDSSTVVYGPGTSAELLGLPSGMEWREVQEHVGLRPDSGWVSVESRRIERAAHPAIWVLASGYYAPESELFTTLDRRAVRRSFANVRNGSVLVRYEFAASGPAPSCPTRWAG